MKDEYINVVKALFDRCDWVSNYKIGGYEIDLIDHHNMILIEIGERDPVDKMRKEAIKKLLWENAKKNDLLDAYDVEKGSISINNLYTFIRIKEGFLGEGLKAILEKQHYNFNCCSFYSKF